ncbi:hypothetical protein ACFFQF_03310 [Haladaptatus pallidirubidus]|uniref:hypothetical protein n=1 Tax=Haladaptatus pallidirubidus TaxID=1008152 RepID=UPI001D109A08|nr:hypothetical protein [Haladaptatus pallidirubidus]
MPTLRHALARHSLLPVAHSSRARYLQVQGPDALARPVSPNRIAAFSETCLPTRDGSRINLLRAEGDCPRSSAVPGVLKTRRVMTGKSFALPVATSKRRKERTAKPRVTDGVSVAYA